jgi:hypothetical protein
MKYYDLKMILSLIKLGNLIVPVDIIKNCPDDCPECNGKLDHIKFHIIKGNKQDELYATSVCKYCNKEIRESHGVCSW